MALASAKLAGVITPARKGLVVVVVEFANRGQSTSRRGKG